MLSDREQTGINSHEVKVEAVEKMTGFSFIDKRMIRLMNNDNN